MYVYVYSHQDSGYCAHKEVVYKCINQLEVNFFPGDPEVQPGTRRSRGTTGHPVIQRYNQVPGDPEVQPGRDLVSVGLYIYVLLKDELILTYKPIDIAVYMCMYVHMCVCMRVGMCDLAHIFFLVKVAIWSITMYVFMRRYMHVYKFLCIWPA